MTLLRRQRGGKRPTPGQRLARRALEGFDPESLEPGWRALSAHYTEDARVRAGQPGISVIAGPGRALDSPGVWIPSVMRIGLDGSSLPVAPEELDLMRSDHFRALATLHGVYIHEVGHAVHTPRDSREDIPDATHEAWALLEEVRMEAQVCRHNPEAASWLRISARNLIVDGVQAEQIGDPCGLAVLLRGRTLAGSLQSADIPRHIDEALTDGIGAHRQVELADILVQATQVADADALSQPMLALAERLAHLRSEDIGTRLILLITPEELLEALEASSRDGATAMEGLGASKELDITLAVVREAVGVEPHSSSRDSPTTGGSNNDSGAAGGGQRIRKGRRAPTPEEMKAKQLLTGVLRRIFLPERTRQRRNRERPGGRLRAREALRADADHSIGKMTNAKPWRHRVHATSSTPKIDVGILIDTSGSMSGTEMKAAGASWIVASAVEALGGHASVAGFGDAPTLLVQPGKVGKDVPVYTCSGGTAFVADAGLLVLEELAAVSRRSELGSDATVLVILSDGGWTWGEGDKVTELRAELARLGVHIVLIGIDHNPAKQDVDEVDFVEDIAEIPEVIGGAIIAAKARVEIARA